MAETISTRRRVLGAIAGIPAIAIVASGGCAKLTHAAPVVGVSSDFAAKLQAYRAAEKRAGDHEGGALWAADRRFRALCAQIPHVTVQWKANPHFEGKVWSTADASRIRSARYFLDPAHTIPVDAAQSDYHQACLDLVAAADERERAIEQARVESGLVAANAESARLWRLCTDAADAAIACPVSSARELAEKIAFITELERWETEDAQAAITTDVGRLAA